MPSGRCFAGAACSSSARRASEAQQRMRTALEACCPVRTMSLPASPCRARCATQRLAKRRLSHAFFSRLLLQNMLWRMARRYRLVSSFYPCPGPPPPSLPACFSFSPALLFCAPSWNCRWWWEAGETVSAVGCGVCGVVCVCARCAVWCGRKPRSKCVAPGGVL